MATATLAQPSPIPITIAYRPVCPGYAKGLAAIPICILCIPLVHLFADTPNRNSCTWRPEAPKTEKSQLRFPKLGVPCGGPFNRHSDIGDLLFMEITKSSVPNSEHSTRLGCWSLRLFPTVLKIFPTTWITAYPRLRSHPIW